MKKIAIILVLMSVFLFTTPLVAYANTTIALDFYQLFESNGTIMLIIDSQTGAIEHANKAAADFYGYTIEQLESMKIQEINTLTPEETEKEMQAAASEKRNYFIFKHRLASGDIRMVEVYSCPHTQGDKTILFSIIYDITAKTQLEEKNRMMTNAFLFVLAGIVVFLGIFSFLLFKNLRKLKDKNHEISNSNELRKTFIDADNSLIYLKDENLKYVFINKAVEDFYNKESSEIINHDDFDLTDEEFAAMRRKTDLDVIEKKTIIVDEVKWQSKIFQTTKFPVKLLNGLYGVGAYIEDITEHKLAQNEIIRANEQLEDANKQLQENQYSLEEQNAVIEELNSQLEDEAARYQQQKETLQAIVDSIGAGIIMIDLEGKTTFINDAWKDIFSYLNSNSSYNLNDSFYIDDETCCNTELFIQNMMTGMENKDEILNKLINLIEDRDSRYAVDMEQTSPVKRFLHLYSNPCVSHAGCTFGRIFVVRDVSHQKEVDRLKLELISTVSHELRTPMSSILGFSELLLTRELSEDRHKEYAGIINSEARRLTNLINDFLDIQRMESGKQEFNKQINSLYQIIEEAVKLFENTGDKHHIIFDKSIDCLPRIYCDKEKMLQVITNMLSNAIKYSPDGGEIKVDLTEENGKVRVSIADHGLGIPEDVKDKLFTKFYRVDNDDRRKIGGTGLGLAICKEIIRAHGGEIGVESVYGEGSTFYFSLSYMETSTDDEPAENENNYSILGIKGNLLIVEDDVSMVRLIKEILKDEGLVMHDVGSGEEALELVARYCYKLIILDIALSGQMIGWDVLKELKNNPATADIPIVISSVYENKGIASQNDITDYLVKPFEPEQLIRVVQKALNGKLNSKMMVNSNGGLTDVILETLKNRGINVKQIEHSGNMLIITLEGEEGF